MLLKGKPLEEVCYIETVYLALGIFSYRQGQGLYVVVLSVIHLLIGSVQIVAILQV